MSEYVLIVEDDHDLATTLEMVLEAHGYTTSVANNGRDALDSVAARMPELIILDMLMPIMDGWEFARELGSRYRHAAPLLVLTAAENARARGLEVDAGSVLPKPFETKKLLAIVERLIAASKHGADGEASAP